MICKLNNKKSRKILLIGILLMFSIWFVVGEVRGVLDGGSNLSLENELSNLSLELVDSGYDWLVNYSDILIKYKGIYIHNIMYLSTYLKNEN